MRFFITGTLLGVLASTAAAGEHYIEIWNPPETRTAPAHAGSAAKKAHHGSKHKLASADRLTTRKVAEPAVRAPAPTLPVTPGGAATPQGAPVHGAPGNGRMPAIPPQIGPDGNVLTVSYRVPAHRAATLLRAP